MQEALAFCGVEVEAIHGAHDPRRSIENADAIMVGGGNTFLLLATLQQLNVLAAIRERALSGIPYVGWSAGAVLACPTIQTTNDMPIVAPASFESLDLIRFQINAHFTDAHPPGFQGETRRQRIREYLLINSAQSVIGLPEGDWLDVRGAEIRLRGAHAAVLFRANQDDRGIPVGAAVHNVLREESD